MYKKRLYTTGFLYHITSRQKKRCVAREVVVLDYHLQTGEDVVYERRGRMKGFVRHLISREEYMMCTKGCGERKDSSTH